MAQLCRVESEHSATSRASMTRWVQIDPATQLYPGEGTIPMMRAFTFTSLAVLGASAFAQSSVTLFGVVDATVSRGAGSVADRSQLTSGGNSTSRVGFRGTEALGGGMSAGFWLEAGITADDGLGQATNTNNQATGGALAGLNGGQGLTFNRRSTVSLSGPWGEVRAGRDHVAHYRNRLEVDPFGNIGVGAIQPQVGTLGGNTSTRVSNFVGYYLPASIGGVFGFAQYYMGENASNAGATEDDGTGASIRLGYATGPFSVSVATGRTQYARTATAGDITSSNIGLAYKFGRGELLAGYFVDKVEATRTLTGKGASIGGAWSVGNGDIKAAYSYYGSNAAGSPETKKISLGYVHKLSKRTAVYGTYARVRNSGGAASALNRSVTGANQGSSGFDLGVRHTF
jgi:predicted porin